jgi:crossover junction endodeoxyribonuclease RuvC
MILGIDPGMGGALVLMDEEPIEWLLMPAYEVGKHRRVNCAALARWLKDLRVSYPITHAYMEMVGAMPGQGVTSMFSFGHANGSVVGVLATLEIPITFVTPQSWKKAAGLMGTDKDAARSLAINLWPKWEELDSKGKGQALADAALIARYGK